MGLADYRRVDAKDNPQKEPQEVIGSVNLADMLRDVVVARGTFAINGHEFRDFEARSPGEIAAKIDDARSQTGVSAEIDDEMHLVLVSTADIQIASGAAFDLDRQAALEAQRDRDLGVAEKDRAKRPDKRPERSHDILDLLGLEANADHGYGTNQTEWKPGRSAEERQKAREAGTDPKNTLPRGMYGTNDPALHQRRAEDVAKIGGGAAGLNKGPSDTQSSDPHNRGDGGPYTPAPRTQEGLAPADAAEGNSRQREPYVPGRT